MACSAPGGRKAFAGSRPPFPEDIALDAVLHRLARESSPVRVTAESLAGAHAELLRRLGE
ncbi:hypothetical protein ACFT4A_31140 [Streptomyces sp. NPDC057099]|uniref:hypothetical protein n=1 Tax=Streptomyces sp. NPDC057099 TaxID=3346019 RepID=UPI00362F405E